MTSELEAAARAYRRTEKALAERRLKLAEAIVKADRAGVRQVDIVASTGYTRERVRQIIDQARKAEPGSG